jgi:hypothetical protein
MFVPGKPFQPSLMFASKAGAYMNEAPFSCFTIGSMFFLQKLGYSGKASHGQTLFKPFISYSGELYN